MRSLLNRLILSGIVTVGFAGVWSLIGMWLVEGTRYYRWPQPHEYLDFLEDGTAVITSNRETYRDLDGKKLPDLSEEPRLYSASLALREPNPAWIGRAPLEERIRSFTDNSRPLGNWFFMADGTTPGRGFFVGFNSDSHARIGFLGTKGFRSEPVPTEEQFPLSSGQALPFSHDAGALARRIASSQPGYGPWLPWRNYRTSAPDYFFNLFCWCDDGKVYRVDLNQRTVNVALEDTALRSLGTQTSGPSEETIAVFRKADTVVMVSTGEDGVSRYPIPAELRGENFDVWGALDEGASVICLRSEDTVRAPQAEYKIYWVDAKGQITKQATTTLRRQDERFLRWAMGAVVPAPAFLGLFVSFDRAPRLLDNRQAETYTAALGEALYDYWPALALVSILSLGLASACYRRQTRYAAHGAERWLWPLFVLLFGLPGWIGYRYGHSWPVLERCGSCGKLAPGNAERCAACQAEFPLPALKGSEVFA
jgi:hypothetical protein